MLTNFSTVYKRLQRLKELEEIDFDDVTSSNMTKKELLHLRRERDKLERSLGGIRDMARVPSAIWVVDTKKEHIAISEARKLGIPVIAILDTNCDPDEVNYPIPGNDDAIRSVALLTRVVADAVADGLIARAGRAAGEEKPQGDGELGAAEPLAEWERELLEGRTLNGAPQANGAATPSAAAAADTAGTDTASTDTASTDTASTDTASTDTASTDTASTDTASTDTASTDTASTDTSSTDNAGADTAGAGIARSAAEGSEAAPAEAALAEATSTDAASAEAASTDTASSEEASAEASNTDTASTEA